MRSPGFFVGGGGNQGDGDRVSTPFEALKNWFASLDDAPGDTDDGAEPLTPAEQQLRGALRQAASLFDADMELRRRRPSDSMPALPSPSDLRWCGELVSTQPDITSTSDPQRLVRTPPSNPAWRAWSPRTDEFSRPPRGR